MSRKHKLDRKKRGHKAEEESSKYVLVSEGTVSCGLNEAQCLEVVLGIGAVLIIFIYCTN